MPERVYKCEGPLRGWCGHEHTSLRAAWVCVVHDARKARRRGRVTPADREVVPYIRNSTGALTAAGYTPAEREQLERWTAEAPEGFVRARF